MAILIGPPAGYVVWESLVANNFGSVEQGRLFRSAQLSARALTRVARDHRIKTILNLRGVNASKPWYQEELAATTKAGATQVDISLSASEWMSRAQLRTLVNVLDTSEYPLLIHCQWGSERTGLASAIATLLRPGSTLEDARNQLSLAYLYVRAGSGKVMAEHIDQYEHWLETKQWVHTSDRFRQWVDQGFIPGTPSREQWPYDPYPLVVTRPGKAENEALKR